ncbi:hypothetical protein SHAM105786_19000 [Shewanella amazonensis]
MGCIGLGHARHMGFTQKVHQKAANGHFTAHINEYAYGAEHQMAMGKRALASRGHLIFLVMDMGQFQQCKHHRQHNQHATQQQIGQLDRIGFGLGRGANGHRQDKHRAKGRGYGGTQGVKRLGQGQTA